jgi:sugar fermentation stimulation protein A
MPKSKSEVIYKYPLLFPGTLIKRYKRFFADIELDNGEVITAHCPNTGPMAGIYIPGNRVWVSHSNNPKRKLKYTWELIEVSDNGPVWVGVNTMLPNRVTKLLLEKRCIPELASYEQLKTEVSYGQENSRIDFVLTDVAGKRTYVEVKNTTWVQGQQALFPDAVTTRGQRHLREMTALLPDERVCMLYFINRGDCLSFAPGDAADPHYGQLLRQAVAAGMAVFPCRFDVSPSGLIFQGLATLDL